MAKHSVKYMLSVLKEEYINLYLEDEDDEEKRESLIFNSKTRVFADLHANDPDQTYALEWRAKVAKRLNINENVLPPTKEGRDYTIGELVEMLQKAEN